MDVGLLAGIVVRTAVVLVAVDVGFRFIGQRHVGELNVYDLLVVLVIANAVQNAMTRSSGKVAVAFVAAGTLIVAGWLIAKAIARWPALETRLMVGPIVVVRNGQLLRRNLRQEGITEDEVLTAMREQGLMSLSDVSLAVLEMDGIISVVPKEHERGN